MSGQALLVPSQALLVSSKALLDPTSSGAQELGITLLLTTNEGTEPCLPQGPHCCAQELRVFLGFTRATTRLCDCICEIRLAMRLSQRVNGPWCRNRHSMVEVLATVNPRATAFSSTPGWLSLSG